MEKEIARLEELEQKRALDVQKFKYKYLKPLVDSLEVQMNGKEA